MNTQYDTVQFTIYIVEKRNLRQSENNLHKMLIWVKTQTNLFCGCRDMLYYTTKTELCNWCM